MGARSRQPASQLALSYDTTTIELQNANSIDIDALGIASTVVCTIAYIIYNFQYFTIHI